jgi:hypothetical protein
LASGNQSHHRLGSNHLRGKSCDMSCVIGRNMSQSVSPVIAGVGFAGLVSRLPARPEPAACSVATTLQRRKSCPDTHIFFNHIADCTITWKRTLDPTPWRLRLQSSALDPAAVCSPVFYINTLFRVPFSKARFPSTTVHRAVLSTCAQTQVLPP